MKRIIAVLLVTCLPAAAEPLTGQELSWITKNRELLKSRLKDPSSAEFKDETISRATGAPIVCGEVNAKNGFGGRNGFQRWIGAGTVGVYLEQDVKDFGKLWAKICEAPKSSSSPKGHLPLAR